MLRLNGADVEAARHLGQRGGDDGAVQIFHEEGARDQTGDVKRRTALLHLPRGLPYGVSNPLRPALRSNAWISDPRVRSPLASGRTSATTGAGGAVAARSCILRASLAETATGPVGTMPLSAAVDLGAFSACRCRRSMRRLGGTRCTCGSSLAGGGAGCGAATTVAVTGGSLRGLAVVFFFAFTFTAEMEAMADAARGSSAAARKSRARSRRVSSISI